MKTRDTAFGTDFGGVINPGGRGADSFFSDNFLETPRLPDSFETLAALNAVYGNEMYVVSKCGPRIQDRTLRWMEANNFYGETKIAPDHIIFCLERIQKAGICRELGIRAFIDDHADVFANFDASTTRYLFGPQSDETLISAHAQGLIPVASWTDVRKLELEDRLTR